MDFLGVLAPPFFLGVLKSLLHTSHTQRPEETERLELIATKRENKKYKTILANVCSKTCVLAHDRDDRLHSDLVHFIL